MGGDGRPKISDGKKNNDMNHIQRGFQDASKN